MRQIYRTRLEQVGEEGYNKCSKFKKYGYVRTLEAWLKGDMVQWYIGTRLLEQDYRVVSNKDNSDCSGCNLFGLSNDILL